MRARTARPVILPVLAAGLALHGPAMAAEPLPADIPTPSVEDRLPEAWRASAIVAADAATNDRPHDSRGTVSDIVIGPEGRVLSVLVTLGGNFGIGEMIFSIPWNQVVFSPDLARVIVDREGTDLAPYSPYGPIDEIDIEEIGRIVRFEGDEVKPGAGLRTYTGLLETPSGAPPPEDDRTVPDLLIDAAGIVRETIMVPAEEVAAASGPSRPPVFGYSSRLD